MERSRCKLPRGLRSGGSRKCRPFVTPQQCQESSPDRGTLHSLMTKPIQRFPQFILLLQVRPPARFSQWSRPAVVRPSMSKHLLVQTPGSQLPPLPGRLHQGGAGGGETPACSCRSLRPPPVLSSSPGPVGTPLISIDSGG